MEKMTKEELLDWAERKATGISGDLDQAIRSISNGDDMAGGICIGLAYMKIVRFIDDIVTAKAEEKRAREAQDG